MLEEVFIPKIAPKDLLFYSIMMHVKKRKKPPKKKAIFLKIKQNFKIKI